MKTTRRGFLQAAAATGALLPFQRNCASVRALRIFDDTVSLAQLAADPLRPQIHLLPKRNWMNDPNGPIFWKGRYHMFFQYNPNAAVWGDMHWAHASSPDMIHWNHLPVALAPTPGGYDSEGCFSGSAVDDGGTATIIYTGVKTVAPQEATLRDGTRNFLEVQCLATAVDDELGSWKKLKEPVLLPPKGPRLTGFRDPCLWQEGKHWYMGVGSGIRGEGGCVLLYRSADLRAWEYVHPLAKGRRNEKTAADPVDTGEMWECPDFFALGGKHVLLYSTERKVYWEAGDFDTKELVFHAEAHGELDHGAFYAPKSQLDAKGRRILWGWIPETRPELEFSAAGWAGCMSLPRALSLGADGTLQMEVVPEVAALRETEKSMRAEGVGRDAHIMPLQKMDLGSGAAEIEVRWGAKPFHLVITDGAQDIFKMAIRVEASGQTMQIGEGAAAVNLPAGADSEHAGRILLDGSVVECFVDERLAWTTRAYHGARSHLGVEVPFSELVALKSLKAWPLRAISPDRLTS